MQNRKNNRINTFLSNLFDTFNAQPTIGEATISRPQRPMPRKDDGPRINSDIRVDEVRLVDSEGNMKGVVKIDEALKLAEEEGLDLVEVSPNAEPPVCKILDYGKYKYEQQKKANEARKKQKTVDVKEVKMSPRIEKNDYDVKMRNATRFLNDGNKVKVSMRFRGREMAHQDIGRDLFAQMIEELGELATVELKPKFEGRQMIMILAPAST